MKQLLFSQTLLRLLILSLVGCSISNRQPTAALGSSYAVPPNNLQVNLTDAPNDDVKSVMVNVDHAELFVSRSGKEARLIVAQGLGLVDLLTLQNGVVLPMAGLNLAQDTTISQVRLVLNGQGNSLIKADGSTCDLQTPSATQSGVKFLIQGGVTIEQGYSYSLVADFDAKKSIVIQGDGGCLLKPVIRLKSVSRISEESDGAVEEPIADSTDSTQISDDPASDPPVVSPEDL